MESVDMKSFTFQWFGNKNDRGQKTLSPVTLIPEGRGSVLFRNVLKKYFKIREGSKARFLFNCLTVKGWDDNISVDTVRKICLKHLDAAGIVTDIFKAHSI
jgi:hypothetical protein